MLLNLIVDGSHIDYMAFAPGFGGMQTVKNNQRGRIGVRGQFAGRAIATVIPLINIGCSDELQVRRIVID